MKEQILAFFSSLYQDGLVLDYTCNGEIEIDVQEGGCFDTGDLGIEPPGGEVAWYGLWMWEGNVKMNELSEDIEYMGTWRRLTAEEIVDLVKGLRVVEDLPGGNELEEMSSEVIYNTLMKSALSN